MSLSTGYYPGGYSPSATQHNKAWEMDSTAGTYTAWDQQGTVTQQRALTTAEITSMSSADAADQAQTNAGTIRGKIAAALAANQTFLALATPTNAQTLAQVQRLTKETNGLLRYVFNQLQDISDT
jgi:hypothetical protein